jgi:hypothetical protein
MLGPVLEDHRESLEKTDAPRSVDDPARPFSSLAGKGRRPKWDPLAHALATMPEAAGSRALRLAPPTGVKPRDVRICTIPGRRYAGAGCLPPLSTTREAAGVTVAFRLPRTRRLLSTR